MNQRDESPYTDENIEHFLAFDSQVPLTIRNVQHHHRLKDACLETIRRLAIAAHTARVRQYSALVATQLGIDDETVEQIRDASLMHNVGKIGIPDRILLKRGPLTAEGWEIMKSYTAIGGKF